MGKKTPTEIHLKDYTPSRYIIDRVFLHFDLYPEYTLVKSILSLQLNPIASGDNTLCLNGEDLTLRNILIDGKALTRSQYQLEEHQLIIPKAPTRFTLETEVLIKPAENTALSGLYQSRGNYCTQCEAQGFRRITFFLDRPDVMTRFTTTISADKNRYPVLLSNGNLIDHKDLEENRHWVMWEDPSLKPSYLFALVAGDYQCLEDTFTTKSQRNVDLRLYVEKGNLPQSNYAMESLIRAMKWDEETYGREYDLDIYMICAVSDFNMGAMENKGLNIFNDRYILAKPDTATDDDYIAIESVIGHEYFHNWSGNRVTVRDWFQITLKEGLTIFRDQNFTADMTSSSVKRIKDVNALRNFQFAQDAGPMAHSIRPESYIEVNNFYTVTVYNKGAEVIRMLETLLGKDTFRKAMDIYFSENDGKAVTTDHFLKAMKDASGLDLNQFTRWYKQAGTPIVNVTGEYDSQHKNFKLHFKQTCPSTPGQANKEPFLIPIRLALLNKKGEELVLTLKGKDDNLNRTERVISLTKDNETFVFEDIQEQPIPSLLRNFSAPVKLHYPYTDENLIFLMAHDTDGFNAWDAGQQLATKKIIEMVKKDGPGIEKQLDSEFTEAFRTILNNDSLDKLLIGEMLTLPSESYLLELIKGGDIEKIFRVRKDVRTQLANALYDDLLRHYVENSSDKFSLDKTAMGKRRMRNLCLSYLMLLPNKSIPEMAMEQFHKSDNLTDRMGVLSALTHIDCKERDDALSEFYDRWQNDMLVVDKWFSLHAISSLPTALKTVKTLLNHRAFDLKNPNKARALIGVFAQYNYLGFHQQNGEGYAFLASQVMTIDAFNPQLSARLVEPLIRWRKYDAQRQLLMKAELERIAEAPSLSNDLYEIVTKSL